MPSDKSDANDPMTGGIPKWAWYIAASMGNGSAASFNEAYGDAEGSFGKMPSRKTAKKHFYEKYMTEAGGGKTPDPWDQEPF